MKAIQYHAIGGYVENTLVEIPSPTPADDQVLISMRTVGINPLDNTFRSGHHWAATPENLPRVGGQTGVGQVAESKSPLYKVGDRVFVTGPGFGIIVDGTWRELVAASPAGLAPIPEHVDIGLQPEARHEYTWGCRDDEGDEDDCKLKPQGASCARGYLISASETHLTLSTDRQPRPQSQN